MSFQTDTSLHTLARSDRVVITSIVVIENEPSGLVFDLKRSSWVKHVQQQQ